MNVAVISFDQELIGEISKGLSDWQVKSYTDSLSLLRDMNFFDPDVIIYDASGGEFDLKALEFFLSRDKIQGKVIKVLVSQHNPIDREALPKKENLEFYEKETEIDRLIEELKNMDLTAMQQVKAETTSYGEEVDTGYQPPADMEALLGEPDGVGEEEIDLSSDVGSLEDVNELLKEIQTSPPPPVEEVVQVSEEQPVQKETTVSEGKTMRITVEISPEELKRTVVELAVEKLIEDIKNDADIQGIKADLQKDFFDRVEEELRNSVEELKTSIKEKLFQSIEADLKENIKESIKEDVTRITTELVKEKLNQVFGQK
ncbi:MAG: hypothetical protein GXN94_02130 [Aquificae bacterium]|nr:hypothetical protein [Aquificota bacterium]